MADLTLERIAELRRLKAERERDPTFASLADLADGLLADQDSLLDAAERGLTNDRKAAAFDALVAFAVEANKRGDWVEVDFNGIHFAINESNGDSDFMASTLLEAVEQLIKEPTDADR